LKKIIFIGGSGFIGRSYLDAYNRGVLKEFKIKKIYVISRNPGKLKKHKSLIGKNIKLIKGDISKIKKIPSSDVVIYGAENVSPKKYKNKKKVIDKHIKAINNFCKIIKKHKKTRVLYISSGAVYAIDNNVKNISSYKGIYGFLKKYSENRILELSRFKIKTTIARCFSFIGPWLSREEHYAIGNFINDGLKGRYIKVKAKNKIVRSYMYTDDLAYWLTKISLNAKIKNSIYDVGSSKPIEIRKLAKLIGKLFNKPVKKNKIESGKIEKYLPNIRKAQKELNLKINYNLMNSVYLTINSINEKIN
jgi:dTDP-glucose 4,6-dehydratase|tara:strand:+ start:695 stop:1609 length:915 start_codon:yes stop_codon:yes gene_type:complete